MRSAMGKYVYARAVGERDLNRWLENGWEYVTEERPNVYLIKQWIADEPEPSDMKVNVVSVASRLLQKLGMAQVFAGRITYLGRSSAVSRMN
jgi:hypothetical protein